MKKQNGFNLFAMTFIVAIAALVLLTVLGFVFDNPGATEDRAKEHASAWIKENGVSEVKRFSCAHDSDGDGYGTCTIVTETEKIFLQCPSSISNVIFGATACKEVDTLMKMNINPRN